ncbi:START domain [Rhizoctonia solani]|uniref:START domain n=1 Tax=Rhizoctonia solani TaxID=456999 RepID=A0A8H7M8H3_9AGAM|nr:START domain [Rhizoctonia solani]
MGARVILACRSQSKGEEAKKQIIESTGNLNVELEILDCGSFTSVRAFLDRWKKRELRQVDVLINNAGERRLDHTQLAITEDGHEQNYQVNHLSHVLLTHGLLNAGCMAPNGRIISVSSSESYSSDSLNKGNLGNHDILSRFNNKVGTTLSLVKRCSCIAVQRRPRSCGLWHCNVDFLQRRGGKVSQYTPVILGTSLGSVKTTIWSQPGGFGEMFDIPSMLFKFKVSIVGISNEEGAANIVWLAVAPEPASPGMEGLFWDRMEWKWVKPWSLDIKLQDELGYLLTAMSDGARLHELWASALSDAATTLKSLVGSNGWVRVSTSNGGNGSLHKKGNVFRAVMEIDEGGCPGVDEWRAIFSSPSYERNGTPRDAITISRTVHDASTIIDISTSLPRSPEEPAYLRPSPPMSDPCAFASMVYPTPNLHVFKKRESLSSGSTISATPLVCPLLHDNSGTTSPEMGPAIGNRRRRTWEGNPGAGQREVELRISPLHAWEAQISTRAASEAVSNLPWTVNASRSGSGDENNNEDADRTVMRITHPPVPANSASSLKVKLVIELGGGSKGTLRINGAPHAVSSARLAPRPVLDAGFALGVGAEALSNISSSAGQANISGSVSSIPAPSTQSRAASITSTVPSGLTTSTRTAAAQKSIQTLIRRSYTYFTALLQEPDIKWRPLLESRGVTVTQLDSIDPTLVVYRAEATFVGVGVWDLLGVLGCEPARVIWEKNIEDARLIEDVSELSELWRVGWKAAWPVNPRDTIVLKTSYKSPTAAHVFSFSTSDVNLFPLIPPSELPTIRTHVDLHGFAIEALSPTTTLLTLLEQSSASNSAPWTGIGETVIRGGGAPPVVSRLSGAKKTRMRYDHDRGIWRIEYERSEGRTPTTASPKPEGERRRRWKQSLSGLGSRSSSLSRRAGESDEDNEGMGASVATIIPNSKRASSPSSSPESPGGRSLTPSSLSSRSLTPSSTSISSGKGIAFPSSEPSNDSNSTINGAGETSNPIPAPVPPIELELRVDPDNWAPLEIVVDPPPSAVRALRRHRLARGGGAGGWDDRINVAVRKAAPPSPKDGNNPSIPTKDKDSPSEWEDQSSGGEGTRTPVRSAREELLRFHGERARAESTSKVMDSKSPVLADRPGHQRSNSLLTAPRIQTGRPTLVVNGARVKVDVEDLPEAEAKALAKAKRVKPMRIPLDEPPVLRTKREKPSEDVSDVAEGNEGGGVGTDGEDTGRGQGRAW